MGDKGFSSPREESLEIAFQTRRKILDGKSDSISTLRACLVVAANLNKKEDENWIKAELFGYAATDEEGFPNYRIIPCQYQELTGRSEKFERVGVILQVPLISSCIRLGKGLSYYQNDKNYFITVAQLETILSGVIDKCFMFLHDVITELRYGGVVEYIMEEIRKNTDERLNKTDSKMADETQSLYSNLTSTNPADWNKVGHSCRKLLKLVADHVFPPRDEKYSTRNGKTLDIGDPNYINRLCAFFDQNISGEERKLVTAELEYLESYLHQISSYAQSAEHAPSIEKYHADMLAVHTYLILSEVLRHLA